MPGPRVAVEHVRRATAEAPDAGRTLQGKEEDERKERESTTAADDTVRLQPALCARLTAEGGRLRGRLISVRPPAAPAAPGPGPLRV